MDIKLLNKIPKEYHAAINDIYEDLDGYWIIIGCESGWKLIGYYADYTIHEDTISALIKVLDNHLKSPTIKNDTTINIPKKYRERIEDITHDSDGYWVGLRNGWCWDDIGLHLIHEDTQKDILRCVRETKRCTCKDCL